MQRRWLRWLLLLLALLVVGILWYQWMLRRAPVERAYVPKSFEELMATSESVIVGSAVTSSRAVMVGNEPMTLIGVDVTRCFKGDFSLGDRVLVLQYNHWQDPHIAEGETVFLFLKAITLESETVYMINGLYDGHYKLQGDQIFPALIDNPDMEAELKKYGFSLEALEVAMGLRTPSPTLLPTNEPVAVWPVITPDPNATQDPNATPDPSGTPDPNATQSPSPTPDPDGTPDPSATPESPDEASRATDAPQDLPANASPELSAGPDSAADPSPDPQPTAEPSGDGSGPLFNTPTRQPSQGQ